MEQVVCTMWQNDSRTILKLIDQKNDLFFTKTSAITAHAKGRINVQEIARWIIMYQFAVLRRWRSISTMMVLRVASYQISNIKKNEYISFSNDTFICVPFWTTKLKDYSLFLQILLLFPSLLLNCLHLHWIIYHLFCMHYSWYIILEKICDIM